MASPQWKEMQQSNDPSSSALSSHDTVHEPKTNFRRTRSTTWRRRRNGEVAHDHENDIEETIPDMPPHKSGMSLTGKMTGKIRRASVSIIKGIVHRRSSEPGSSQATPEYDNSHEQRPTTAWRRRLRSAASFSRHHFDPRSNFPEPPLPAVDPFETIYIPGGAAARAAAKAAALHNDDESGIGIAVTATMTPEVGPRDSVMADDSIICKVDFISCLPSELAVQILSHLDAATLSVAARVSKEWNEVARDQHVWRQSFLREKTRTFATSVPVQPGKGLGVPPIRPGNDWKKIYRAKHELDRKWREGHRARPVYLNGHIDSIYCLQFDESKIITGSRDKTIRIWDMHTFECRLVIGPPEVVNDLSIVFDPSGKPVHYAATPESYRAHESVPATVSFPVHHKASILCLQYDETMLVTGSSDSSCIVYSIKAGYRPVRRLQHHTAAVLDLAFDDKHIVTCSKDITICVWDRNTGVMLKQLKGHTGPVNAVQLRGSTIVSCSGDFKVKLWNIDSGKVIREFVGHTKGLACSQFSEDGRYIASAGSDKMIRIWDSNTGECIREMPAHENLVRSLHIDSISGRLVSGSYDTDIKVFDMETGNQLLDFPKWHSSWVLSAKSDYRRIISTGQDPKILIMDFGADIQDIGMLESTPMEDVAKGAGFI